MVIKYAAQNQTARGVPIRCRIMPAVIDVWYRHAAHYDNRGVQITQVRR
jgi:hypothetical protein